MARFTEAVTLKPFVFTYKRPAVKRVDSFVCNNYCDKTLFAVIRGVQRAALTNQGGVVVVILQLRLIFRCGDVQAVTQLHTYHP